MAEYSLLRLGGNVGILKRLFLTKEIISKKGVAHFRRYRLISTPILRIYLHQILKSDEDDHLHDHPWNFFSIILRGHYVEKLNILKGVPEAVTLNPCKSGAIYHRRASQAHCIYQLVKPTWTLVVAYGRYRPWGYLTEIGWIDHKTYRDLKNAERNKDTAAQQESI